MKPVHYSTKAKKDLKRYRNDIGKMRELHRVLTLLANDMELPAAYKAHKLVGQYTGCLECHVGNDFLLIWLDEVNDAVNVVRIGSHSELF